jgi:sRNA-binding protein
MKSLRSRTTARTTTWSARTRDGSTCGVLDAEHVQCARLRVEARAAEQGPSKGLRRQVGRRARAEMKALARQNVPDTIAALVKLARENASEAVRREPLTSCGATCSTLRPACRSQKA